MKQVTTEKIKAQFSKTADLTREFARNTLSAAEFIAETVRLESRHFAHLAVVKVTTRITGHVPEPKRHNHHDSSLEPLAGVEDPQRLRNFRM